MCTNLGGSVSNSGNNSDVWSKKTVDGYEIDGDSVKTPSGRTITISNYREVTETERKKFENALKKSGISDPVMANYNSKFQTPGIVPRKVAEMALSQGVLRKETFSKNVPVLEKLRDAISYDKEQVRKFSRSVYSGSGMIKGSPTSNTASAIAKSYPRAASYIKAESYHQSSNYTKSQLGEEAMNKIAQGKSATAAIREMERKWKKYANRKAWD